MTYFDLFCRDLLVMDFLLIAVFALAASCLTFFSGFGLGTILVPVFGLFFPIQVAIALTAIVHFLNNIFKLFLTGRHADKTVLLRFGLPSLLASLAGAWLLTLVANSQPLFAYNIGAGTFSVVPIKLVIGILLIVFSLLEIIPAAASLKFGRNYLVLGGLLSGFFGGLSGNQGALRSAFLYKAGLSKEAFIATGVIIACMVDSARLLVYSQNIFTGETLQNWPLLLCATLAAFAGALIGNKLLKKIKLNLLQALVAIFLIVFGVLLSAGIL